MRPFPPKVLRRVVIVASVILVLVGVSMVGLNSSSIPERVGKIVAGTLARTTGWEMTVGRVEFVAPTRLLLSDVDVNVPSDAQASDWIRTAKSPTVYVSVNPIKLLLGNSGDAPTGKMTWVAPEIELARPLTDIRPGIPASATVERHGDAPASQGETNGEARRISLAVELVEGRVVDPTGAWLIDGAFSVGGAGSSSSLALTEVRLKGLDRQTQIEVSLEGREAERQWRWRAMGPAILFNALLEQTGWELAGAIVASGVVDTSPSLTGTFDLEVSSGDVRWGGKSPEETVAFDTLTLSGELGSDVIINELRVAQETGVIHGSGRVEMANADSTDPVIQLDVYTRGLELPAAIPFLSRYGLSGKTDFSGVLAGPLHDLELSGRLTVSSGTVWHRPIDRGEGVILLETGRFTFGQTVLERGSSRYRLKGEWQQGEPADQLRIELTSQKGRAEEILAALGQEGVDVEGEVDGDLLVAGLVGDLHVSGSIEGRALSLWNQPLDGVRGAFRWERSRLTLSNAVAELGGGTATVSGELTGDELGFRVAMARWPLDLAAMPQDGLSDEEIGGWVSYEGMVSGTVQTPVVTGRLTDGDVRVGRWQLANPNGSVTLDTQQVLLDDLEVTALGGGEYQLSGSINRWMEPDPAIDLNVNVRGASLSTLLSENGLSIPALLVDGEVVGTIAVSGTTAGPDARFDLALQDEFQLGAPIRLRFQYVDGRLKFGGIPDLLGLSGVTSAS